jgi:hypothetical protein
LCANPSPVPAFCPSLPPSLHPSLPPSLPACRRSLMTFWQVIAPYAGCQPSSNSMVLCRRWAMEPLLGHCRLLYRQHESAHAPAGEQRRSGKVRWGWCLCLSQS